MVVAFHGYSLLLCVMFWGSQPDRRSQRIVLLIWPLLAVALWWALGAQLNVGWSNDHEFPAPMLLATALAVPSTIALAWRVGHLSRDDPNAVQVRRLRWLVVLSTLFMAVPQPALSLSASLHPYTFDAFALRWDYLAGLRIAAPLSRLIDAIPALPQMVVMAYGLTPLAFLSVALLQLRGRPPHVASALLTWVVLTGCAFLAYHALPITGPRYVFGSGTFLAALQSPERQPLDLAQVGPYPRNGLPSMHFGWCFAASILWWRSRTRLWSRAAMIAVTTLTTAATLYTGEHYVVDLVVAVPFVLGAIALCTVDVAWRSRSFVVAAGFISWLVWVLLLRLQIVLFIERPWLCQVLLFATAVVVALQARSMARFDRDIVSAETLASAPALQCEQRRHLHRFGWMFFFSGMAALVYQVLFAKELALVFGSTATATFTVLATFLGGMAIGSLIGGRWAHRMRRPLVSYALIEVAIAGYCAATPALFALVQSGYVALATGLPPDAAQLLWLRVGLGAAVLLPPTVMMGTTLPILAQALGPRSGPLGSRVAWLYFANTAGAALGALLAAYFVIPILGAHRTTLAAAVMNLMVALGALELAKRADVVAPAEPPEGTGMSPDLPRYARSAAMLTLGVGGLLSLGLEVVYVHMLSIVAGNSVYAFGLMVATFLVGLSVGGRAGRGLLARPTLMPTASLALCLLGLCASVALGTQLWNSIPDYFASYANYPEARGFAAREVIRGLVCSMLMLPPTLFIGASYVLAIDIVTRTGPGPNTMALGWGAAINTLGNILGVLLFGFVVLPLVGGLEASRLISLAALLLALSVMVMAARPRWPTGAATFCAALMLLAAYRVDIDYDSLSSGANVYFFAQRWGTVVDHAESIDGGLTTVVEAKGPSGPMHTLLTNGKFQGNDSQSGEMRAQLGFAMAPLLHQDRRDRALVIGYGTGVTTRVFHEAGFRQVDVAELSRDVVLLADRHFASVNAGVSHAPGVDVHFTDGRNFLLLSPNRYDVVSLEITSIWFAGAASLYNREFYQLAKTKMQPDGVLQQWMQLHRLSPTDILQIVATLRSEFRYVSIYEFGTQGVLVATNAAERAHPAPGATEALANAPRLAAVRRIADSSIESMSGKRLLEPVAVDRYLAGVGIEPSLWISTDDNLRLEYDTPKANVNDSTTSYDNNRSTLLKYR